MHYLTLVQAFACCTAMTLTIPATPAQETTRVSVGPGGAEAHGESERTEISADGRIVLFSSLASDLVPGDLNQCRDAFVHDRTTGVTSRVSVDSFGVEGNADTYPSSVSADGRFVAFYSSATNLVSGDTNGWLDVFVHDRETGETTRVSVSSMGVEGDGRSERPSLSADGRLVAFHSLATNLVQGDTNGVQDVFVHDRHTGMTRRVSVSSQGVQGNQDSGGPAISGNGEYVAFHSSARSLVVGDANYETDCFVHHLPTRTTKLVSVDIHIGQGDGASVWPSISFDGRLIAFESDATIWDHGTNHQRDVFLYWADYGTLQRVSESIGSTGGNERSTHAMISADGNYCVFQSLAYNLVDFDTNGNWDIFLKDLRYPSYSVTLVSSSTGGAFGNDGSIFPSVSAFGTEIAFNSYSTNLVPGDGNGNLDVFVKDLGVISPELSHAGACPGVIDLAIARATPAGKVAILQGPAGTYVKSGVPCAGVIVGISNPVIGAIMHVNGVGGSLISFDPPAGLCGRTLQAIDLTTCLPSNPIVL